jgi:methylglutaconyl-CoA hydratase
VGSYRGCGRCCHFGTGRLYLREKGTLFLFPALCQDDSKTGGVSIIMNDTAWKFLHLETDNHIGVLTLSRPPVNALSERLIEELKSATVLIGADTSIDVLIIQSNQRHFCAGADLKEREMVEADSTSAVVTAIRACFTAVEKLPQPTIAAVNGSAVGGGAELALACDLRIMAEDARFGFAEVSLGIIPGAGGTQRLPRLVGPGRAKEMIFTGSLLSGKECSAAGLADRIVPGNTLHQAARDYAWELVRNAPLALRAAKRTLISAMDVPLEMGLKLEGEAYDSLIHTQDRVEGLKAFREKRPPEWRGR